MKDKLEDNDLQNMLLNGRFLLEKRITEGGMSTLYRGKDLASGLPIVVKFCTGKEKLSSFKKEIKIVCSLHHPAIQKTIAIGSFEKGSFYVMPYYGTRNFRKFLMDKPLMLEKEMLEYFLQITDAVAYLHSHKIIHNDLKLQNILIYHKQLILIDFGLASRVTYHKSVKKKQKTIWASPVYLAPEISQGFNPSYASDVYALGILLFILILGYPPFYHDNLESLIYMHQTVEPPHPHFLSSSISEELEGIILHALAKSPADRFNDAAEFQERIKSYYEKNNKTIDHNWIRRQPGYVSFDMEKTKTMV